MQVGTDRYYSVEVRGPILPTAVQQMCDLLCSKVDQYSLTLASQDSTKAFTLAGTYVPSKHLAVLCHLGKFERKSFIVFLEIQ